MKFITLFLGVLLLNLFAFITIKLRPRIFKVKLFKPMIWNFKLSVLPMIILIITILIKLVLLYVGILSNIIFLFLLSDIVAFLGMLVWLLLLPNAGYLITELNLTHRDNDEKEVPIWYDIVSTLSFALSGIINTLANIVLIQLIFLVVFDPLNVDYNILFLSGLGILLLIVIGIYLGRSIRFNSWDILHLKSFFKKLKLHFAKKGVTKDFVLYVVFNVIFFVIMYITFGIPFYFAK